MRLIAKKILESARDNKYAVPAFNVYNIETINAILKASMISKSPVILALSPSTISHMSFNMVKAIVGEKSIRNGSQAIFHLDHGYDISLIKKCIDIGFDSVMVDRSMEDLSENIRVTKDIVSYAKHKNVAVEAELGCVSGFNAGTKGIISNEWLTDPHVASEFVRETGVDFLAIAIGTQHGPYQNTPILDIERIYQIKDKVSTPLVLHGASGLTAEHINQVIDAGITKVNIATDLKYAFTNAVKQYLKDENSYDLRKYLMAGQEAITKVALQKIDLFRSEGKISIL